MTTQNLTQAERAKAEKEVIRREAQKALKKSMADAKRELECMKVEELVNLFWERGTFVTNREGRLRTAHIQYNTMVEIILDGHLDLQIRLEGVTAGFITGEMREYSKCGVDEDDVEDVFNALAKKYEDCVMETLKYNQKV